MLFRGLVVAVWAMAIGVAQPASATDWYFLNGYNGERYQLFRYAADGLPDPPAPIVGPHNDGGATHVAWPSAFQLPDGRVRLYASRYLNGKWSDIAVWHSEDGISFKFDGPIFAATEGEPYGIGPAQVYYAKGTREPYKLIYLVRNAKHTGERMDVASSVDGMAWTRKGTVLEAAEEYEKAGVSPSFVARSRDGRWVLFYQAYRTLDEGPVAIATSRSPEGPFTGKRVILEPNAIVHQVRAARRRTLTAQVVGKVKLSVPHILRSADGKSMELITPVRQSGDTIWFDRPILEDYDDGATLAHIATAKIDPSFAAQSADGTWHGVFTGYGHFKGVTSEYTFRVRARSLYDKWSVASGVPFTPWHPGAHLSAENPTPLVAVPR